VPPDFQIRPLCPADSIDALTDLLHRAYAPLAADGFRFVATHQTPDVTAKRCAAGHCLVAEVAGAVVGTITWYDAPMAAERCPFYARADVARFGQFGVEPGHQKLGIGSRLLDTVERRAAAAGFPRIALDTAEGAAALIAYYTRRGYEPAGHVQWSATNYRSLILCKPLRSRQGPTNDQ
jgi:GNAT superfamily N-acetyltransferase